MPKVQTTSVKNGDNRGVVVEVVCVLGAVVAVLAAGPLCWQHEPFHAQLNPIGGMVGSLPRPPPIGLTCASKGPRCPPAGFRPPPIGLTCASMGPRAQEEAQATTYRVNVRVIGPTCELKCSRAQDAFTETEEGLTAHRPPDAPHASPETTEAGPRTVPPLVAYGNRAVGAEKSPYQQHVESYNPRSALLRPGLVDLGLSAVLPATEKHRRRRGQSRVLHANLDHGRAHRLVGATAGNDTAGQRSGPTATRHKPRTPNGLTEHATT